MRKQKNPRKRIKNKRYRNDSEEREIKEKNAITERFITINHVFESKEGGK